MCVCVCVFVGKIMIQVERIEVCEYVRVRMYEKKREAHTYQHTGIGEEEEEEAVEEEVIFEMTDSGCLMFNECALTSLTPLLWEGEGGEEKEI